MRQDDLFTPADDGAARVPGLLLVDDFIDAATERALLAHVDEEPWEEDWRRRIRQYGHGYGATRGSKRVGAPRVVRDFPPWLSSLAARVVDAGVLPRLPDDCVVNEYPPGIGIGPHRDYPDFDEPVVAVSLGGDVVIDFDAPTSGAKVGVVVRGRSLWAASGPARWTWRHGIAPRLSDVIDGRRRPRNRRVSVTFRLLRDA